MMVERKKIEEIKLQLGDIWQILDSLAYDESQKTYYKDSNNCQGELENSREYVNDAIHELDLIFRV